MPKFIAIPLFILGMILELILQVVFGLFTLFIAVMIAIGASIVCLLPDSLKDKINSKDKP